MDPDSTAALFDSGTDFQKLQPQGVHSGSGQFSTLQVLAQQPHQAVGICVQQQPELVGSKPVAAKPIRLQVEF